MVYMLMNNQVSQLIQKSVTKFTDVFVANFKHFGIYFYFVWFISEIAAGEIYGMPPLSKPRNISLTPQKKKESLPLKIKVVQVTYFCLTSFSMLRVMPAMKSLTFPQYTLFFIRTSKFCLRLAVLKFFPFLRLKCSYIVLISPTEPCNATKKNARMSTIKTHYFISFILFLSSSTHGSHWEVFYKKAVLQLC